MLLSKATYKLGTILATADQGEAFQNKWLNAWLHIPPDKWWVVGLVIVHLQAAVNEKVHKPEGGGLGRWVPC